MHLFRLPHCHLFMLRWACHYANAPSFTCPRSLNPKPQTLKSKLCSEPQNLNLSLKPYTPKPTRQSSSPGAAHRADSSWGCCGGRVFESDHVRHVQIIGIFRKTSENPLLDKGIRIIVFPEVCSQGGFRR